MTAMEADELLAELTNLFRQHRTPEPTEFLYTTLAEQFHTTVFEVSKQIYPAADAAGVEVQKLADRAIISKPEEPPRDNDISFRLSSFDDDQDI